MKIVRRILSSILILFVLYCIVSVFIPSKLHIGRRITINAPASLVFEQINNFKNWQAWSYWDNIDTTMQSIYEGPENGKGAVHRWSSRNRDVGSGSITITESKPDSLILDELNMNGMLSRGGWRIKDTTEGVTVNGWMDMEMGFLWRIPGLMMDKYVGTDFEKTLQGLKKRSELVKLSKPLPQVVEVRTQEQILASYRAGTTLEKIAIDIALSYQKIGKFMIANNLQQNGPVCAFYHGYSNDRIDMECAIPVDKEAKSDAEVHVNKFPAQNAVELDYYGPYMGTSTAHAFINKWISDHHKKISGSPWEVYVTDPMVEKDTAKWLTKVYYPVE